MVWLLIGTRLPDLIDEPLAWTFDLVPSGRMLVQTPFVAVPACWLVHRYWRWRENPGYGVGYLSYVFGDAIGSLLLGEYVFVRFLVWPLLSVPVDEDRGILSELATADSTFSPAFAV